jgi:hypothetical protein
MSAPPPPPPPGREGTGTNGHNSTQPTQQQNRTPWSSATSAATTAASFSGSQAHRARTEPCDKPMVYNDKKSAGKGYNRPAFGALAWRGRAVRAFAAQASLGMHHAHTAWAVLTTVQCVGWVCQHRLGTTVSGALLQPRLVCMIKRSTWLSGVQDQAQHIHVQSGQLQQRLATQVTQRMQGLHAGGHTAGR